MPKRKSETPAATEPAAKRAAKPAECDVCGHPPRDTYGRLEPCKFCPKSICYKCRSSTQDMNYACLECLAKHYPACNQCSKPVVMYGFNCKKCNALMHSKCIQFAQVKEGRFNVYDMRRDAPSYEHYCSTCITGLDMVKCAVQLCGVNTTMYVKQTKDTECELCHKVTCYMCQDRGPRGNRKHDRVCLRCATTCSACEGRGDPKKLYMSCEVCSGYMCGCCTVELTSVFGSDIRGLSKKRVCKPCARQELVATMPDPIVSVK